MAGNVVRRGREGCGSTSGGGAHGGDVVVVSFLFVVFEPISNCSDRFGFVSARSYSYFCSNRSDRFNFVSARFNFSFRLDIRQKLIESVFPLSNHPLAMMMMMMMNLKVLQRAVASIALLAASKSIVAAFTTPSESRYHPPLRVSSNQLLGVRDPSSSTSSFAVDNAVADITSSSSAAAASTRRAFLATSAVMLTSGNALLFPANAADGQDYVEPTTTTPSASDDAFESIASRAARVAREVTESEVAQQIADEEASQRRQELVQKLKDDVRTIYDFSLPVNGKAREISELLGQTFSGGDGGDGWTDGGSAPGRMNGGKVVGTRVKAILVVNMKQDDPIARKNIPELIELLTR